jgi:two-component system response regulator LytT
MLKAYIVDDEPLARDELTYILRRLKQVEVVGEADSIERTLEEIRTLRPDVVFLDIQLAEDSGLDLARRLLEYEHRPAVVFATAYDEYALKAFELEAIDYVLKPFDEERIRQTVDKLTRLKLGRQIGQPDRSERKTASPEKTDKLAILEDERFILVSIGKIVSIHSTEGKTIIVTDDRQYTVTEPLVSFEQKLQGTSIVRVHRAFLVNLDAIVEIQPWFHSTYNLVMKDGSKVPVSRTHIKELKQFIGF